jgi:hypothetical protein
MLINGMEWNGVEWNENENSEGSLGLVGVAKFAFGDIWPLPLMLSHVI